MRWIGQGLVDENNKEQEFKKVATELQKQGRQWEQGEPRPEVLTHEEKALPESSSLGPDCLGSTVGLIASTSMTLISLSVWVSHL